MGYRARVRDSPFPMIVKKKHVIHRTSFTFTFETITHALRLEDFHTKVLSPIKSDRSDTFTWTWLIEFQFLTFTWTSGSDTRARWSIPDDRRCIGSSENKGLNSCSFTCAMIHSRCLIPDVRRCIKGLKAYPQWKTNRHSFYSVNRKKQVPKIFLKINWFLKNKIFF